MWNDFSFNPNYDPDQPPRRFMCFPTMIIEFSKMNQERSCVLAIHIVFEFSQNSMETMLRTETTFFWRSHGENIMAILSSSFEYT